MTTATTLQSATQLSPMKKLLAEKIQANRREICEWYLKHAKESPPPFYSSIDLRDAGYKIVPVDSNLFPAGFNNICQDDMRAAPPLVRAQIDAIAAKLSIPAPQKILIIPETHTSNQHYIENLYYLTELVKEAGFEVQIGWYSPESSTSLEPILLTSASQKVLEAHPIQVSGKRMTSGSFDPDLILLNNDFSGGYPVIFDGIEQPIVPSYRLGWHSRKKSEHFQYYNQLAGEFAALIGIDPWLIQIDTEQVGDINFNEEVGIDRVAEAVQRILSRTETAYAHHQVPNQPFVFVKNNAGTYGMGITVVHSADEIRKMNRRTKNKMSVGKNRSVIESVAVQEGVPTATLVDRLAAEPVIYLLGCELMGGFLRTNTERGAEDNLNSQGMVFRKLCMSDLQNTPENIEEDLEEVPVLELVYGTIARISALATGKEIAQRNANSSQH